MSFAKYEGLTDDWIGRRNSVQKSEDYIMQLKESLDTAASQPSLQSFACIEEESHVRSIACHYACSLGIPSLNII